MHSIRFHLTGGLTGTAYGEPRMTQDIDIVIDPIESSKRIDALLASLADSDFLYDESNVRRAIQTGGMFQLLDRRESLKLDLYPRELIDRELERSIQLEIFEGCFVPIVSRVDAAGSKLIWISKGSHKSRRDLRAIYRFAGAEDRVLMQKLASTLGLRELMDQVLAEPDEIE
jgi:Nucleotidyl transferase AbiEii toxin, Type IV TA system